MGGDIRRSVWEDTDMTQTLVIRITADDPTDLDWLRSRCLGPVEDAVATAEDEGRLDGNVSVDWDTEDA